MWEASLIDDPVCVVCVFCLNFNHSFIVLVEVSCDGFSWILTLDITIGYIWRFGLIQARNESGGEEGG